MEAGVQRGSLGAGVGWAQRLLTSVSCALAWHKPGALISEGPVHGEPPEHRTCPEGETGLRKLAVGPATAHGPRANLPGAAAAGWGGRAHSPRGSALLSGCWCSQEAELVLSSH